MLGVGNIATKVGDGDVIVGMFGVGNVLTHVGDGMSAALMVSVGAWLFRLSLKRRLIHCQYG
jgi:RTX toxin RtxA